MQTWNLSCVPSLVTEERCTSSTPATNHRLEVRVMRKLKHAKCTPIHGTDFLLRSKALALLVWVGYLICERSLQRKHMYPVKNRSFGNFPLLLGVHFIKSLESEVTRRFNHIMTGGYSVSHNGIKLPSKGELRKKSSSFALAYSACLLSTAILARHGETVMRQLAQRENELYRFAHRRRCWNGIVSSAPFVYLFT